MGLGVQCAACVGFWAAQAVINARASLRRCCSNYNRASFGMVRAWEQKGAARERLLKQWMASGGDVASTTVEIVTTETFTECSMLH